MQTDPIRVAFISTGLGVVNRGMEVSTARYFQALKDDPRFDCHLYCGAGYPDGIKTWNIGRSAVLRLANIFTSPSEPLRRAPTNNQPAQTRPTGSPDKMLDFNLPLTWRVASKLEEFSFFVGLMPDIFLWKPEIIWTQQFYILALAQKLRNALRLPYKIVCANGVSRFGNECQPSWYHQFDYIQHFEPGSYEAAVQYGIAKERMWIVPHCITFSPSKKLRADLRQQYGYAQDDWIVICVAAWDTHKRVGYVIDEVAQIPQQDCKLLLCGDPGPQAEALKLQARQKLGDRVKMMSVPASEVPDLLAMSDVFVLASLHEAFGLTIIEAIMAGLPIICHEHSAAKFITGDDFWLGNLTQNGSLAKKLHDFHSQKPDQARLDRLKENVIDRFGKEQIAKEMAAMFEKIARPCTDVPSEFNKSVM